MFVEWSEAKDLEVPLENEEDHARRKELLGLKQRARAVATSTRQQRTLVAVQHEWYHEFIGTELGIFYN